MVHSWRNLCRLSAGAASSRPRTSAAAEGDQAAAVLAQHVGAGAHRGRLARPGRADPGQQQPLVARERHDQGALPRVEPGSGEALEPVQCRCHRRASQAAHGGRPGGVQQPLLGVEDGLAGEPAGRVLGEHRFPVGAAELCWLVQERGGLDRDGVPGRDGEGGDRVGDVAVVAGVEAGGVRSQQALGLGPDVPCHSNNNNRFNLKNEDKISVMPGVRTYGLARLLEQQLREQYDTYIGRDASNYRGNRQNPMDANKRSEYEQYQSQKTSGC
jgi:hypothetical protein